MNFTPNPVAFTIPLPVPIFGQSSLPIYWYGIIIVIGAIAGAFVASIEAKRKGIDPDHVWNALLFALLFGVLGARLYHVLSDWAQGDPLGYFSQDFMTNLWRVLNPREGGLGIFGAAVGGLFGVWLYARFAKVQFWSLADVGFTALPLGQAIGRWGNFFNQELFGYPTDLPWGITIDAAHRNSVPQFASLPDTTRFHPTFLYESLAMFLVTGLMLYIARRWDKTLKQGDMVLIYGILYPLVRFFTEMQRPDAWKFAEIPVAQIISIATFVVCAIWFLYRHTGPQSAPRGKTPVRRAPGASSTGKPA